MTRQRLSPSGPFDPLGSAELWVNGDTGHDLAPGTETAPVQTLARALELVRQDAVATIWLEPSATPYDGSVLEQWTRPGAGVAVRAAGPRDEVVAPFMMGTSTALVLQPAVDPSWPVDRWVGLWAEVVESPDVSLVGVRKMIHRNVGDSFRTALPFPAVVPAGSLLRFVRPAVEIGLPRGVIQGPGLPTPFGRTPFGVGLLFEGISFRPATVEVDCYGTIYLLECRFLDAIVVTIDNGSAGVKVQGANAFLGTTFADFLRAPNGVAFGETTDGPVHAYANVTLGLGGTCWGQLICSFLSCPGTGMGGTQSFQGGRAFGGYLPFGGRHQVGVITAQGRQTVYLSGAGNALEAYGAVVESIVPIETIGGNGVLSFRENSYGSFNGNLTAPVCTIIEAQLSSTVRVAGNWAQTAPPSGGFRAGVTAPEVKATLTTASVADRRVANPIDESVIYRTGA